MNQILLPLILLVTVNLVFIDMVLFKSHTAPPTDMQVIVETPVASNTPEPTRLPTQAIKTVYITQPVVESGEWYIPLGSGVASSDTWVKLPGVEAEIDTSRYPKNATATFEVFLSIPTANGVVEVKLYNESDKHDVWTSTVSSEGNAITKRTATIALEPGSKTYSVLARSSLKYETNITNARVHIQTP